MNPYEVLGVKRDASGPEIRRAYRLKCKECHPDRDGGSHEKMADVNMAYEILSDKEKKARYDRGEDPGKREPTLEEQAFQSVCQNLVVLLQDQLDNLECIDIAGTLKLSAKKKLKSTCDELPKVTSKIDKLKKSRARFKKAERFLGTYDQLINALKEKQKELAHEAKVYEKVVELLEPLEYDYDKDKRPVQPKQSVLMAAMLDEAVERMFRNAGDQYGRPCG